MTQERKNKLLTISLIALLSATVITYYLTHSKASDKVDKAYFKVADLDQVDRIILQSKSGGEINLAFNGSRWTVNKQHDADRNMISVLFATLQQAEVKRPIATNLHDSIKAQVMKEGVQVSLFNGETVVRRFYAGGNVSKTQAYFLDAESNLVYVMAIPGYKVYVSGIFELDEGGWRNKYVFGFNWRNFESLKATFPSQPQDNFTIARDKDYFSIQGLVSVDTAKLNTFLDQVSLLTVDQYASSKVLFDSLQRLTPKMQIIVSDIGRREYALTVFSSDFSGQIPGIISNTEVAFFHPQKIKALFKPKSFFKK